MSLSRKGGGSGRGEGARAEALSAAARGRIHLRAVVICADRTPRESIPWTAAGGMRGGQ